MEKKSHHRGAEARRVVWGVLWGACLFSASAQAIEIRVDAVAWQYEETSADPLFLGTPFHSKANTLTLEVTTIETSNINDAWQWRSEFSSIIPTAQATETWSRSDFIQTNDLRIGQLEGQLALMRKLDGFDVGVWGALRWQQQARQQFKKNGAPLADGLITETIRTAWFGAVAAGQWWRLLAGVPAWVRTTNSSISNVFSKRDGFRVSSEAHWPIATALDSDVYLNAAYRYQQLGGDAQTAALWPKNRFQTISLGASAEW